MKKILSFTVLFVLLLGLIPVAGADAPVDATLVEGAPQPGGWAPNAAVPASGLDYIILDDFNRADGPIGDDWEVHDGGYFNIVNNAVQGGGYARATYTPYAGDGMAAEADVAANGTALQFTGLVLNFGYGVNNPFLKVQEQSPYAGQFTHAACYLGSGSGSFGLGFFALDSPFTTAHMKATRVGNTVTIEFTNVDGGGQPDQTYVCDGAPPTIDGNGIGIVGYAGVARLDNFGIPGEMTDPDIEVTPTSLYAEQCQDEVTEQTLQICNVGGADLEWSLSEVPPPMAGSVEIALAAGPDGADPGTAAAGAFQARPAGSVALGPGFGIDQPPDILLLEADYDAPGDSPIETLLQAYGDLGAIDFYDAQAGTPTLGELTPYDVVLTWSNYVYLDPVGIGNVLADYVDAGGKVINLMFSMGTHGWAMQGRFINDGYTAMNGTNILYAQSCLGSYDPGHPVMTGVTDVCETFRLQSTYLTSGSTGVAYWQDGEIFVAAKDDATVVSIGGYVGQAFLWTGQMPDVLHNAILWLAGGEPPPPNIPWLSEDPTEGMLMPQECVDVAVTFDSDGLDPGNYFGDLDIESNDPDEPQVMVPVEMNVLNCNEPDIYVTPESLLAEQCPDAVTEQTLYICNEGLGDLTWELSELVPPKGTQDVLWDNGPLVTHPGGGYGGADLSALQTTLGLNTYGFGNQYIYTYRMADDFEVDTDWNVDQITFFAYQTNSPTDPSTITGLYFQIWDGLPDDPGSSIVFGDLVTNRLADTFWTGIYRAVDYDPTNSARPIMANIATAGVALPPGEYWLDWLTDGSLSSGPWAPPISILGETTTGNAMQNTGVWAAALDTGTGTQQGMPFIIEGTAGEPPDLPWLSEDPTSGMVPAGECAEVTVTFDSTGLAPGDYFAELLIESNDPDEPAITVPVQLTVEPCENTMHVADIQAYPWANPGGFPAWVMGVRVVDGNDVPLGEVFVEATVWIPGDLAARDRYSLPNGWARFWAPAARTGNYQICVDNLTLAGYTYNPDDNVVTCMDWDL